MRELVFENQGTNTYLVYAISPDDVIDSMSLGMLTNNKIPGLATTLFTQMDAEKYIKYNVSAKVSVSQFFSGAVNRKRLLGVFRGIVNALMFAEDYMLDENTILLDLDYIFADVSTCETVLVCLPIQGINERKDLGSFFKEIMFSTQFDQTENCEHVAEIINYLNSTPAFSLMDFKNVLDKIEQSTSNTIPNVRQAPVEKQTVQSVAQPQVAIAKPNVAQSVAAPPVNKGLPMTQQAAIPSPQKPLPPSGGVQPSIPPSVALSEPDMTNEKKMSMLGLLMHYSKENKELYKEQKASKKNASKKESKSKTTPKQNKNKKQKSFVVPGAPASDTSFVIPGQMSAMPTPQGGQGAVQSNSAVHMKEVSVQPSQGTGQAVQPGQMDAFNTNHAMQTATANVAIQQSAITAGAAGTVAKGRKVNFGETTVLGGGSIGETTVLGVSDAPSTPVIRPRLIRAKNNEEIMLDKPVFRIGKEKSYVDYFIGDNTAISRSHANIISRENEYFVVDTNSTNHTYVNGVMIQSNIEIKIAPGDKVRLANEDFEFQL